MVNVLVDDPFGFSVFPRDPGRNDFDRTVRAVVFANAATIAAMLVVRIVNQNDFTLEPFKHLQVFPVFRILLRYNLPGAEEIPACDRHPDEQGLHPVENI